MPKLKIEDGDWITLQVRVTRVWDGELTFQFSNGNKETIRADSEEIVDVTKERQRGLFDKAD